MTMRGYMWVGIVVILILPAHSLTMTALTPNQSSGDFIPIKFWRADPVQFRVNESNIFPMITFGSDTSFANLGKAWITWTIDTEGGKFAAIATYYRGEINNFTVLDGVFTEVSYFAVENLLIAVASTATRTNVYFFTNGDTSPIIRSLPVNSTRHEVLVLSQTNILGFARLNNSRSAYLRPGVFSIDEIPTHEVMVDSAPGMAIIRRPNAERVIVEGSFFNNHTIPDYIGNNLRIGHYLLTPVVFDLDQNLAWGPTLGNVTLPSQIKDIQFFGLQSSLIIDTDNRVWQLTPQGAEQMAEFGYDVESMAIIDINLYVGTIHRHGIELVTFGNDEDGDLLPDTMEDYYGSFPQIADSDADGINDQKEVAFGTNPRLNDMSQDYDVDGLTNQEEYELGTDPTASDTDFGGALDGWEHRYAYNPLDASDDSLDEDGDGSTNAVESIWNSDPRDVDTDGDHMDDTWEIKFQLDPTDPTDAHQDPDNDGRDNLAEYRRGSDPLYADSRPLFDGIRIWVGLVFLLASLASYFTVRKLGLV